MVSSPGLGKGALSLVSAKDAGELHPLLQPQEQGNGRLTTPETGPLWAMTPSKRRGQHLGYRGDPIAGPGGWFDVRTVLITERALPKICSCGLQTSGLSLPVAQCSGKRRKLCKCAWGSRGTAWLLRTSQCRHQRLKARSAKPHQLTLCPPHSVPADTGTHRQARTPPGRLCSPRILHLFCFSRTRMGTRCTPSTSSSLQPPRRGAICQCHE